MITATALLSKWVDDSGLTLRELELRTAEQGNPVSFTYIGKLKRGEARRPSLEVLNSLAKAMNKPAPILILASAIEETGLKLPDILEALAQLERGLTP